MFNEQNEMDHLKVIGAVFASFMLAGTIWWFSSHKSSSRTQDGEKEVKRSVIHPEVPASIKLRHERILRTKPKKRQEAQPQAVSIIIRLVYSFVLGVVRRRGHYVHSRQQEPLEKDNSI